MHFPPGFFQIFLSTVDKMIGTKYISTKYVDRSYNIHLQNTTTTLLPIIQELFFHVIIFFVLLKLKTYIVFLRKISVKNVFKNKQLFFSIKKKSNQKYCLKNSIYDFSNAATTFSLILLFCQVYFCVMHSLLTD